jgi:hypothetical protein
MEVPHPGARRLTLATLTVGVLLSLAVPAWRAAGNVPGLPLGPATQVVDSSDQRFDVLVQRRPARLGTAGGRLSRPEGRPRLTAARAFALAGGQRQPNGAKPSVRLATFTDADFPTTVGPARQLISRAVRALVWVVVVPDVPEVELGPDVGARGRPGACPTWTPVDALTGEPLGTWQFC